MRSEIIIVLDSVGYQEFIDANTPNMNSLGSVHLAMSHACWTFPSLASMLGGYFPWCTVDGCPHRRLVKSRYKFLEEKRDKRYNVYIYTSNPWLLKLAEPTKYYKHSECLPDMLSDFFSRAKHPFFVFFHLMETHMGYSTAERKRSYPTKIKGVDGTTKREHQLRAIAYVDRQLKKIVNMENVDVIITADHAEIFAKDRWGHTYSDVGFDINLFKVPIVQKGVWI